MLGNGRLEALCFDGEKRLAHIRGKLRKKVWINQGDIILLSLRDYQDEKGDVILKYSADEARSLKAYGELPETAKINETDTLVLPSSTKNIRAYGRLIPGNIGTVTRVWMTTLNSTRTETTAVTKRTLMLTIFEWGKGGLASVLDGGGVLPYARDIRHNVLRHANKGHAHITCVARKERAFVVAVKLS